MSEAVVVREHDVAVEAMRAARSRPSVLKIELATLRSAVPDEVVFAFEGDDDKIVYRQWVHRASRELTYVNFPCRGKGPLLELRASLKRDKTGLSEGIFFFADRDFDDLRGQEGGDDIFVTDAYSVENYLVDASVVSSVLEVEFHCHDVPALRSQLTAQFLEMYDAFLSQTEEVNRRLFIARRLGVDVKPLPKSIGKLATVGVRSVAQGSVQADAVVVYERDLAGDASEGLEEQFAALEPRSRYRGKFALLFMEKWLRELAVEAGSDSRGCFAVLTSKSSVRVAELTLTCFASLSPLPDDFREFVESVVAFKARHVVRPVN